MCIKYLNKLYNLSGKTTLSKAIYSYEEPEPVEERTIGLDFFEWKAEAKHDGLKVLIVDCAGQKKYVLTHQLFMQTGIERCISLGCFPKTIVEIFLSLTQLKLYLKGRNCEKKFPIHEN